MAANKFEVGDKFIIEIEKCIESEFLPLYKIKGFNALVFDGFGLEKLERVGKAPETTFKVGDEVVDNEGDKAVVVYVPDIGMDIKIMFSNGYTCRAGLGKITKTGKTYPGVAHALEALRGGDKQ